MNDMTFGDLWGDLVDPPNPFVDAAGENGPELWEYILHGLKSIGNEGAIIAGGCVRDHLLGVAPKDIDIFVPSSTLVPPPTFDSLFPDLRAEEYEAMDTIDVVMRGEIAGITCDLIGVSDFASGFELIETFDFGISRCFFDGVIVSAPEATFDRENKVVTLYIGDRRERAQRRFDRFNERMGGGWILVEKIRG